jgi:hypothetical protein
VALEMLTSAIRTKSQPPERQLTVAKSLPSIEELAAGRSKSAVGNLHRSARA